MWGFEVDDGLFACDGGDDGLAVGSDFHFVVLRFYQHLAALVHDSPVEGHILDEEVNHSSLIKTCSPFACGHQSNQKNP